MASVAIPMVAGFVVNKVGESQGWDPRMTAIAGAVASGGAGMAYGAASAASAVNTANAAYGASKAATAASNLNMFGPSSPITPTALAGMKAAYTGAAGAAHFTPPDTTFGEQFGRQIDAFKANGKASQLGLSALKTLMQPLPEEPPISSGGGGGGGPVAPAYQGGGGGGQYQTVWSFGQPNKGYKPQGI